MDARADGEEHMNPPRVNDRWLSPYAERSYSEIAKALGISKQLAQIVATNAMRKLQRLRHTVRFQTLLETGRELRRFKDQRPGNSPWNDMDEEAD